jgi:hypothetical protein
MSLPVAFIIRTALLTTVLAVSRKEDHAASASCTPEQQLLLIRRQILTATETSQAATAPVLNLLL